MRQMEGQEAVFNGSRMELTIGLLNFIGPVAASTSESCRRYQPLLREERKEGRCFVREGRGYSQLSFMNSFRESFWTSFFLGARQPRR